MERETGIEPATNSLEGCDSTTELLPPISLYPSNLRSFALAQDLASRLPLRSRQPSAKPQRLKPRLTTTRNGTTKVVPFQTSRAFPNRHNQSLEPMIRIELMTSPLPRECSTN